MKTIMAVLLAAAITLLAGCELFTPTYNLDLYVSLGPHNSYPADPVYSVVDTADLSKYWGKPVVFSARGDEPGNDSINIIGIDTFGWTGGDPDAGTQYAVYTIDLADNTTYQSGRYTFRIYIDWNGNSTLDSGDLVMGAYSVYADMDGDPDTGSLLVDEATQYGTSVVYDAAEYEISIEDPLSGDSGLPWVVTSIGEGALIVFP